MKGYKMFTRKPNEQGNTLGEMIVAMAIAAGCTAMVTPAVMNMMDDVQSTSEQIVLDKVESLQQQADTTGSVTMSAEDFKALTDKLTATCQP